MNVCFNGLFYSADEPLLTEQNRSFKWGDGLFETAKIFKGRILLSDFHFERLFMSIRLLQMEAGQGFTKEQLIKNCTELCRMNNCSSSARVRLAVYRNEENRPGYVIEAIPLSTTKNEWQADGLTIALYPYARKSMDVFSNIKSANFLPYVLAERYAFDNGMDDAIVLNAQNFLCDSSKANIFLIRNGDVFTPATHQGCINGVMRRMVIECVKKMGYRIYQQEVKQEDLATANEVFLTNAIQIIRWVKSYNDRRYDFTQTRKIFDEVQATIFNSHC